MTLHTFGMKVVNHPVIVRHAHTAQILTAAGTPDSALLILIRSRSPLIRIPQRVKSNTRTQIPSWDITITNPRCIDKDLPRPCLALAIHTCRISGISRGIRGQRTSEEASAVQPREAERAQFAAGIVVVGEALRGVVLKSGEVFFVGRGEGEGVVGGDVDDLAAGDFDVL